MVVLELEHLDIDYFMTSPNDEIVLRKVGELEPNSLPRGIHAVTFGNKVVFVRKTLGRLIPVSREEQLELENKHIVG